MLLVILEEREFCVDGNITMKEFLGGVWLAVLLCLSLGMACGLAVVFTAGELTVCIA